MSESKTNIFGKTYNTVGSSESNFIIKTKGDLKVQWGNKYIDLIKNGKVVTSNNESIFKLVNTELEIKNDGIYLIGDLLWIAVKDYKFNITTNENIDDSMFISFVDEQNLTLEQKHKALTNIGLYYKSINDIRNINSGLVYIENDKQLYIIDNGVIKPYINENTKEEKEQIINEFDELKIGPFHLYADGGFGVIDSLINMLVSLLGIPYMLLEDNIKFLESILIDPQKTLSSKGATSESGYKLYIENGISILEIDTIILRKYPQHITHSKLLEMIKNNTLLPKMYYLISDFQNPWEVSWPDESLYYLDKYLDIGGLLYISEIRNAMQLIVLATSSNTIDTLVWDPLHPSWIIHYDPYYKGKEQEVIKEDLKILQYGFRNREGSYLPCKGQITYLKDEYGNEGNFNFRHLRFKYNKNDWSYCMDTKKVWFGDFLIGNNNKFILDDINIFVQIFKSESILDDKGSILEYKVNVYDSDIEISKGHSLLIKSTSNNNTFIFDNTEENIYHYIEEEVTIENNNFENISLLQIEKNSSVKNNIFKNTKCKINGICEDNNINNVPQLVIVPKQKFINNTINDSEITLKNIEGDFKNNIIKNSILVIDNLGSIDNNIIENCQEITIINSGLLEKNNIINTKVISNTTDNDGNGGICENNILNNINNFKNSNTFLNNIISSQLIINTGEFTNNTIKQSDKLNNSGIVKNNIIDNITTLNNNGSIQNNTIKTSNGITNNGLFEDNNILIMDFEYRNNDKCEWKGNNIINIKLSNRTLNNSFKNNVINTIKDSHINSTFENNIIKSVISDSTFNNTTSNNFIKNNITDCVFGKYLDNVSYGNIESCSFNTFTNNEIKRILKDFTGNTIHDCVFNKEIKDFSVKELFSCTFEYINNLDFSDYSISNAIFHGVIGKDSKNPEIEVKYPNGKDKDLLEAKNKRKDVYPNIKVISIPDIMVTGMIMMWYGGIEIPSGWAICDGNNGTPNLVDRFIKGGNLRSVSFDPDNDQINPRGEKDNNTVTLTQENLPYHTHPHSPHTHTIPAISGISTEASSLTVKGYGLKTSTPMYALLAAYADNITIKTDKGISGYYYNSTEVSYSGGEHKHLLEIPETTTNASTSAEQNSALKPATSIKIEPKHFILVFIMKIDENPKES